MSDCWRPSASLDNLQQRARLMSSIRAFFNDRGYWEVETPIMAQHGISDVYLSNIPATFRSSRYWLQTSPEYHMKRLLAAGSGSIFQLARVFRDDELGRWHNPEFTLLEWYRIGVDHHALMDEMSVFLQYILPLTRPMLRKTYQSVFIDHCNLDPLHASLAEMQTCVAAFNLQGVLDEHEQDLDQYLFLLMSHVVEPALAQEEAPVAIYDFPVSQAALAHTKDGVAERFEVYYRGVELANGFHELTDAEAQRLRFQQDNEQRVQRGLMPCELDEYFLSALSHGLPACSGVALGIDRLMAVALNQTFLSDVIAFDVSRS
jgi:elongation factor P--(R)-beta-lysine ligase